MKVIALALCAIGMSLTMQARLMRTWSYQEMTTAADAVVIAKPLFTRDTEEKSVLPDISPKLSVVGVETKLEIRAVLKGDTNVTNLILHHYRLANTNQGLINGPTLVSFDPKQAARFLLFLRREFDGRYAPVSGQTDPGAFSVVKLEGIAQ